MPASSRSFNKVNWCELIDGPSTIFSSTRIKQCTAFLERTNKNILAKSLFQKIADIESLICIIMFEMFHSENSPSELWTSNSVKRFCMRFECALYPEWKSEARSEPSAWKHRHSTTAKNANYRTIDKGRNSGRLLPLFGCGFLLPAEVGTQLWGFSGVHSTADLWGKLNFDLRSWFLRDFI